MNHETAVWRAREIADRVLAPAAAQNDKAGRFSTEAVDALGRGGLLGLMVSAEAGGSGLEPRTFAAVIATFAEADASAAMVYLMHVLGADGQPQISGHAWDSPEALAFVRKAVGADAELFYYDGPERLDVLPLLVATDGAISHMGFDSRRLRPNIIVGGVEGLQEREWPGYRFRIGEAVIHAA